MTEFLCDVIRFFDARMTVPTPYGWYHLLCIAAVIVTACLLCRFCRGADDRGIRRILLIYSAICLAFEVFKQLFFAFSCSEGVINVSYYWYIFPFQFCSIPMYAALIGGIAPAGRLRDAMISFLATYGLLGGLLVMIIPGDVFTSVICINVQTMVHHGLQTAVGLYLLLTGKARSSWRGWLGGVCVFISAVLVAVILNEALYPFIPDGDTFNMFFISPHYNSTLPVFSAIQPKVPHVIFVMLYTIPFTAATAIMHALRFTLPSAIAAARKNKDNNKSKPAAGKV